MGESNRLLKHTVQRCPLCEQQHDILLWVRKRTAKAPLVFGGAPALSIQALCSVTGKTFPISPRLDEDDELVEVIAVTGTAGRLTGADDAIEARLIGGRAQTEEQSAGNDATEKEQATDVEYSDWVKGSRDVAIDFCKTMLTSSVSAIGIYFVILNYLGAETFSKSAIGWISAGPPLLFLASMASSAWGLRPRLSAVSRTDFPTFRDNRMRQLNLFLSVGLSFFICGLILAIIIYAQVLHRR